MDEADVPTIARATVADLEAVIAIYEELARWLAGRGIDQWQPGTYTQEWARHNIEDDEVYLAYLAGEPVGKFTLVWVDSEVWGKCPPVAGYVHGLAVRRSAAGRGLGAWMLDQAAGRIAQAGRTYLRLDCLANNKALRTYYERLGFTHRGSIYFSTGVQASTNGR